MMFSLETASLSNYWVIIGLMQILSIWWSCLTLLLKIHTFLSYTNISLGCDDKGVIHVVYFFLKLSMVWLKRFYCHQHLNCTHKVLTIFTKSFNFLMWYWNLCIRIQLLWSNGKGLNLWHDYVAVYLLKDYLKEKQTNVSRTIMGVWRNLVPWVAIRLTFRGTHGNLWYYTN